MQIMNLRRHTWENLKQVVCAKCGEEFTAKPWEKWCPKCEAERRKHTYSECTDSDGWQKLPGGGHMRRTHGIDTW